MIYWQGKKYALHRAPYNGLPIGYLQDGILVSTMPKTMVPRGYIATPEGVLIILRRKRRYFLLALFCILALVVFLCWPRYVYVYYLVTFSEQPALREGILYCNVLNESDRTVTVQFLDANHKTGLYSLGPAESLPYIVIDFVPELIRYNGTSDFSLEVALD